MTNSISSTSSYPFEGMTNREIMIEIGQISGDESGDDDISFNTALILSGKKVPQLLDEVLLDFKDKISSKYFTIYEDQLRVILANLYEINSIQESLYIFYSRDTTEYKQSKRYNPNGVSIRPLKFLIDNLKEHGWINHIGGHYDKKTETGRRSRIRPSKKLLQAFYDFKVKAKYVHRSLIEEIRLKNSQKKLIEYKDTPTTNLMRNKLRSYNSLLYRIHIKLKRNKKVCSYLETHPTNFNDKQYFRVFNDSSFELGGRFYGPWWISPSKDIRKYITLDDEKTVELDYSSLGIHLLYSKENLSYYDLHEPTADPYTLKGVDSTEREVNKKIITFALNMLPEDKKSKYVFTVRQKIKKLNEEISLMGGKRLHKVPTGKEIWRRLSLFEEENVPIKHYLFKKVGKELQYKDSCIAESIIERMLTMKIPILAIHDSFIVQHWNRDLLYTSMNYIFKKHKLKSIPIIK